MSVDNTSATQIELHFTLGDTAFSSATAVTKLQGGLFTIAKDIGLSDNNIIQGSSRESRQLDCCHLSSAMTATGHEGSSATLAGEQALLLKFHQGPSF